MTIKDFEKMLRRYPKDMEIVLASDEEGNSYSVSMYLEKRDNALFIFPTESIIDVDLMDYLHGRKKWRQENL